MSRGSRSGALLLCLSLASTALPALAFMPSAPLTTLGGAARLPTNLARHMASSPRAGRGTAGARMMADGTMPDRRVVVTGIGAVSAIGTGADFMPALLEGKVGIDTLPDWSADFPCRLGGAVKSFDAGSWYANKKEAKRQSRYMNFAVAGTKLGMQDAKLEPEAIADKARFGLFIGSAIGGSEFYEEASDKWSKHSEYTPVAAGAEWGEESFAGRNGIYKGPNHLADAKFTFEGFKKISPFIVPAFIMNSGSGVAAVEVDAQGPNYCIGGYGGEGTSGALSIGQAHRFLSTGQADVFVAGGAEACLTPGVMAGFNQMDEVAKDSNDDPAHASKPFDKAASGYVIGEGCGVLVLETEDHAKKRGAEPYCELAGWAASFEVQPDDGRGYYSAPTAGAVAQAITKALERAGVSPTDVGYVSAHGSGVRTHDQAETEGIKQAFGAHAKALKISAIKPQMGNCMAASSGFEAAVCAYALKHGEVPGTVSLETPDVEGGCDLDYLPKKGAKMADLKVAVSVNMGMGGQATCLVFKKC